MCTQESNPEVRQNQNAQLLPRRESYSSQSSNNESQGGSKIPLHEKATTEQEIILLTPECSQHMGKHLVLHTKHNRSKTEQTNKREV